MSGPQVNGHLDYMRQMQTILVAVGVPTKEVPGASFALPQPEPITKETPDNAEPAPDEHQATEKQESSKEIEGCAKAEETTDGWDIPDISDLLDSLNDAEAESSSSPATSEETASNDNGAAPAANAQGEESEEDDPDTEHISWSWEDTHWTTEHTHSRRQPNL